MRLSEAVKYDAVITNNSDYDGKFYYAVKTTGIFCRPSCKSKPPNRENIVFFERPEEALRLGYRPCKRCRPDLGPDYAPDDEAVKQACHILSDSYQDPEVLRHLPQRLGISASHFQRLFKKATSQTPGKYLQRLRVQQAAALLSDTTMSNTDICFATGFSSLSSFYAAFREEFGVSPREHRSLRRHSVS